MTTSILPADKNNLLTSYFIFFISLIFYSHIGTLYLDSGIVFLKYPLAAKQFLSNHLTYERFLDFSPLYLTLHILFKKVFSDLYIIILFFQMLLTSFSTVIFYHLCRKFIPSTFSLICTLLFAFNKTIVSYTFTLEPEILLVFLILAFTYYASLKKPKWITAGTYYTLALLVRPNILFLIFIPIALLINRKIHNQSYKIKPFFYPLLIVLVGIALINIKYFPNDARLPMNPGMTFYEANNPLSLGNNTAYPKIVFEYAAQFPDEADYQHVIFRDMAKKALNKDLTGKEADNYWAEITFNFIKDHPIYYLKQCFRKSLLIAHNHRRYDLVSVYWNEKHLLKHIPDIPLGVLWALAIMSILYVKQARKELILIYAIMSVQILLMLILFVADRHRLILMPFLLLLSVIYIQHFFSTAKNRQLIQISMIIALSLIFTIPHSFINDEKTLTCSISQSQNYLFQAAADQKNNNTPAVKLNAAKGFAYTPFIDGIELENLTQYSPELKKDALQFALTHQQEMNLSSFDLAYLYFLNNDFDKAEKIYSNLASRHSEFNRLFFQSSYPDFYLAKINLIRGNADSAQKHLYRVLKQNPGEPWALACLYSLTHKENLKEKLLRYFHPDDAEIYLKKACPANSR